MVATARRLRVSDLVVFAELDGEAVLLEVESGVYFGLDAVATSVWQYLQGRPAGATAEDVAAALAEEYDAPPEQIARDVEAFLASLVEHGLVWPADPA